MLLGQGVTLSDAGGRLEGHDGSLLSNTRGSNLRRDIFDRLNQYKISHGIPAWEQVLERLLNEAEAESTEAVAS